MSSGDLPLNRDQFQSGKLWYWLQRRMPFMPRKRFKTEEIIQKLLETEVLLSQGRNVAEACRQIGVTDNTYYRWRREFTRAYLHRTAWG